MLLLEASLQSGEQGRKPRALAQKPQNQDYFRDPWHVARVGAWRSLNPGYWRKLPRPSTALQDLSKAQPIAVLIGLIAHLVGTPLQEDIVRTTDHLVRLGEDILAMSQGPAAAPP